MTRIKRDVYCQTVFSVKYDGVKAVKTHQESKKHEESVYIYNINRPP